MKIAIITFFLCFISFMKQCQAQLPSSVTAYELRLYRGTPAYELAKAVQHQQVARIKRILKVDPGLVRYQEPLYGLTLLEYAVMNQRVKSVEVLVENGSDPNQANTYDGHSALIEAAGIYESSDLLKLLLRHGGDPNMVTHPKDPKGVATTPLIEAALQRLESVKLLVDAGANINYVTSKGYHSALEKAFNMKRLDIISYLLIDKQADFRIPFGTTINGDSITIATHLKYLAFPLGSERFKKKMEIVSYLEKKGVNYRAAPVPKHYHKLFSKEYLEQY